MKLNQSTSPVQIEGAVTAPTAFNINASSVAFKILSSGLYTNKIRAIIRELSCNAYDAHVAAGKANVPFDIHLPTTYEPFFQIKDEGTGLRYTAGGCPECKGSGQVPFLEPDGVTIGSAGCDKCAGTGDYDAVRRLYCTYFSTDKSDSNEFIGALGLGSKSPFCYTEGFSVTNVYDGKTRIYSCFLNEQGKPAIILQEVHETPGAQNGVEINFPVKQSDVWEFENQAKVALEFFEPRPNINVSTIRINRAHYTVKSERWGLRDSGSVGGDGIRAIQGRVAYGMGDIDISRLSSQQEALLKLPLDIFFPIGDLEVAASRESLSNSEQTILNILKALDEIRETVLEDTKAQIKASPTMWQAQLKVHSLCQKGGIGDIIRKAYEAGDFDSTNPEFKLNPTVMKVDQKNYPSILVWKYRRNHWKEKCHKELKSRDSKEFYRYQLVMDFSSSADAQTSFVINDVGDGMEKYLNHLVQDEGNQTEMVYFITRKSEEGTAATVEDTVKDGMAMVKALGYPPVILASQLVTRFEEYFKNLKKPTVKAPPPRTFLQYKGDGYTPAGTKGWQRDWRDVTKSITASVPPGLKFYIPLKNLEPQTGNFRLSKDLYRFIEMVRGTKLFGIDDATVIYGIPTWKVGSLDNTWTELVSHVMRLLKTDVLNAKRRTHLAYQKQGFDSGMNSTLTKLATSKHLASDSPFQRFAETWYRASNYDKSVMTHLASVVSKARALGVLPDVEISSPVDLNKLWKEVKEQYPLVGFVQASWMHTSSLLKPLVQYIKMVDEQRQVEPELGQTFAVVPTLDITEETITDAVN